MTNEEIRKRALGLFKAHFLGIGLVVLLISILNMAPDIVATALRVPLNGWVEPVWAFFLYPISILGQTWYVWGIWQGNPPNLRQVFGCISPDILFKALGLSFLFAAFGVGTQILSTFTLSTSIVTALIWLVIAVLSIWMQFRFSFASLLFIRDPDHRPMSAMRTSWHITRGNFRRIIGMGLMTLWPSLIILFIVMMIWGGSSLPYLFVASLVGLLYAGYPLLAQTGLTATLIMDAREAPREKESAL